MNKRLAKTGFNKQELEFVGREKVLESIFKKANSLHLGNRILFVTGIQRIGKSRLLQQAHHEVCNPDQHINTVSAYLNLAELENSPAEIALEKLRTRLVKYEPLKISFNLFDYAYFVYLNKIDPFYTPSNYSNRLLQNSGFVSDLMGLLQVFPGVAIGLKLLQMAEAKFPHIKKLLSTFTPELRELEGLEPIKILERLTLYFAKDLQLFLDESSMKAILLLDSYDSMLDQNTTREAVSKKEKWLFDDQRGLFHLLKNTLFVIANREEVPWIKHKEDFKKYYDVERLIVLPSEDTLKTLSVIPEEDIRNSILRISGGHPYSINLAYETYLRFEGESSSEKIAFFEQLTSSKMLQDYFIENITERERILLKILSCSRYWNEKSFKFLYKQFHLGYGDFEFEGFVNHAYVEQYADLNYSLHSLMKESLYSKCDIAFKEKAHKALFEYYNQFLDINDATYLTDEHDIAFVESFHHQMELFYNGLIEIKSLLNWFEPHERIFNSKRRWKILVEMYLMILKEFRDLSNQKPQSYLPEVAGSLNNLGALLYNLHEWDLARKYFEEALGIRRKLAESNPQSYLPYLANTLNNLGNLVSDLHEWDLARKYYEEALGIYRTQAESNSQSYLPEVAGSLNNLGLLVSDLHEWDLARKYYEEALGIYRTLAESNLQSYLPYVATSLNNLGNLVSDLHEWDLARKYYEEALGIRCTLAESNPQSYLPEVATSLKNYGILNEKLEELDQAKQRYQEALSIFESINIQNHGIYTDRIKGLKRKLDEL